MSNILSEVHPELVAEWSDKNLPLTPDRITYGSNKVVWWKGACGHEWQTSVKARSNGENCPICSGARVIEGINDLATLKPELADEWSSKNDPLKPTMVTTGSHKKVIWQDKYGHEYAGQETATVAIAVNNGEPMENKLIYGSVSGKKVDENGEGLGGALIGLFKSDDVEFIKENALMTAVSGDDGSFSFENVPYGNWYIREIEQPTGFVLDETVYDVNISENGQIVEIEIVNELIRGNIALTKVDAEYTDTKLAGAVFEVYKDSNDNGELDSEDELIGTLTEKEIGQYEMNDLLYGRYFVKETKAPEGFTLDEGVYEVFIDTDGKTYQVENTEGKGFANEPVRGNLKIVKTSSDGKVEGFAFRITGANGYDVTLETDEKGEIFIEGLRIGEYKISEVNNSASAMYILPADKEAAVQTGSTTVVEMHNELRDTPKTGDDSKLGLWLALAGVSVAGIAACGIFGFKKKKKKEDN